MSKIKVVDSIMGSGKAQPLDSLVLTETGFIKMKDVTLNTQIFGEDGNLHNVIGIFPQGQKDVYSIIFSDGSNTECCGEHLWTYQLPQDKAKNIYRTESLYDIMKKPLFKTTNRNDKNWQFFIPMTKPINFNYNQIELDPYLLGIILGDGGISSDSIIISNTEEDIIDKVFNILKTYNYKLVKAGNIEYRIVCLQKNINENKIKAILKTLQLMGKKSDTKFIPEIYKYNSIDIRLKILQGLIDTDGEIINNTVYFSTTSPQLAEDVCFLVESLGGTSKISKRQTYYTYKGEKKKGLPSYRLFIKLNNNIQCFTSNKHMKKYKKGKSSPKRTIQEINYIGKKECQCILVDNSSHLYLTNNFIVTHNTSAAINLLNNSEDKFIFITPYLKEIERIKTSCQSKKFFDPINKGKGKLDSLHYLLENSKNIASTHALFQTATNVTKELIRDGEYILILDEVFNVIEEYPVKQDDYAILMRENMIYEDSGYLLWNPDKLDYDGEYNDIKNLCVNRNLMHYAGKVFMWVFPVGMFEAFKEVYILTYMFDAQEQKYYYDLHNIEYEYYYATKKNNMFVLQQQDENYSEKEVKEKIKKLTTIIDDKINSIGENNFALSSSWFDRKENKPLINKLQKNLHNYFTNKVKAKSPDILWTTYKSSQKFLTGKGYAKGFLSCNARATNEYAKRNCLAYCVNMFLNPVIDQFFAKYNVKVNSDKYALSEMLQWIWRSSIRNDQPITIYIPSSRMRNIFINWLNS